MIHTTFYNGNQYIGVYCRASEKFAIVPEETPLSFKDVVKDVLKVDVVTTNIMGSMLVGSLLSMNSYGAVVSNFANLDEIKYLKKYMNIEVIKEKHNAIGNNILVNDYGAIVNKNISPKNIKAIKDALNVEVEKMSIASYSTVGMVGVATIKGAIIHPKATDEEIMQIKEVLKVNVVKTTANFGVGMVGTSVVANSKGALVGYNTTTVELNHISDGLYLDI
ncbi:MAG: translation initiation factor IF-6 [Thermoplasmata archaeon]